MRFLKKKKKKKRDNVSGRFRGGSEEPPPPLFFLTKLFQFHGEIYEKLTQKCGKRIPYVDMNPTFRNTGSAPECLTISLENNPCSNGYCPVAGGCFKSYLGDPRA